MSLLETFVLVFKADAKSAISQINALAAANDNAESSTDDMRKALDKQIEALELQAKTAGMSKGEAILYKMAQDGATKADIDRARAALEASGAMEKEASSVSKLVKRIAGFAAASFSVGAAISGVFARADNIRAIEQTSDAIGASIENVDAFGKAAETMGGDAQGARDSLTDMAEKMGEAMSDVESGAAKAFKSLGISLKSADGGTKDAITGMLDLAGAVEGLDRSAAVFKIKELGITDNRTVEMILKGRQELERMLRVQKEQGVVSEEAAENARKLTKATDSLKKIMTNASDSFLDSMIPALTKVIEWLGKGASWMRDNKDFVIGFFGAIAAVVTAIYLPAMISAAAATLAATWPLLLIGAAIAAAAAAFALIYDDIMNFVDGNDSFIGQIFEKYPMVEKIVMTLIDAFRQMWQILITGAQQIGDFVSAGFQQVISGIKAAVDYLSEAYGAITGFVDSSLTSFQALSDGISAIFAFIVDTVKSSLSFVTAGIDTIKSGVSGVASFFGIGGDEAAGAVAGAGGGSSPTTIPQTMAAANQYISSASSSPSNSITSNAISNSTNRSSETNVQTGDIIVQTQATDAQGIARDAKGALSEQLKGLEMESATGVDR